MLILKDNMVYKFLCISLAIAQNVNIIHISMFKTLPYGSVFFVLNLHLENL